jgi:hypothetical protein
MNLTWTSATVRHTPNGCCQGTRPLLLSKNGSYIAAVTSWIPCSCFQKARAPVAVRSLDPSCCQKMDPKQLLSGTGPCRGQKKDPLLSGGDPSSCQERTQQSCCQKTDPIQRGYQNLHQGRCQELDASCCGLDLSCCHESDPSCCQELEASCCGLDHSYSQEQYPCFCHELILNLHSFYQKVNMRLHCAKQFNCVSQGYACTDNIQIIYVLVDRGWIAVNCPHTETKLNTVMAKIL